MAKQKTKRTKKPMCRKASAYACGFSCITMTKACRQGLEGQSIEIADLLASLVKPKASLASIFARDKGLYGETFKVETDAIEYEAYSDSFFTFADALSMPDAKPDAEIAEQLQDWNGEMYSISWDVKHEHNKTRDKADEKENLRLALQARSLWPKLLAEIPAGSLVYNNPVPDEAPDYKNTRARLYERHGMSRLHKGFESYDENYYHPVQMAIVQKDKTLRPVQFATEKGMVQNY